MTVRLGVTGASGRMGEAVLAATAERDDCEVVLAVSRSADGESVPSVDATTSNGVAVEPASEFEVLVADREPAVVIDFTAPEAAVEYAEACAETNVAFVTGTTGFDAADEAALEAASDEIPLLCAPNFARGVQALVNVVGDAVRQLPGYDVELVETHHNGKRDAPSGTAKRLLREIEESGDFTGRTHGREGDQPRQSGEIGVHALRAGDVTGEHEIVIAGNHEELRLTHRAEDRGVFAAGAVDAATWLAGREPGQYDFADVIDE